jgi:hypothetical protein
MSKSLSPNTSGVPFYQTEWFLDLMDGIYGNRKGGARIIIDAEDAATGVGKTSAAVWLAKVLSKLFGYQLEAEDMTLSGAHYLERWREHPGEEQPSVIILDELGGAGAGNARRAMSNQNVDLSNAWQLMRKKRIVSIVTLPHWSKADKDLRMQADYRLWCRKKPIGYFKPYEIGVGFDTDGGVHTDGYTDVERIRFPDLKGEGDEHYRQLDEKKNDLLDSSYFDADKVEHMEEEEIDPEAAKRQEKIETAQRLRDAGWSTTDVAKMVDMSQSWVSQNTENPNNDD